ncbi:hypothetical protein ZEAMMB73_Zm00001d032063 [Zea mays]|uniref:Uncharacterized protein n=1 Tax=Zea mays TaxID=4577 RepID=A0A1D6KNC5_MAIZE|nr:hypothetical protein ZEAMMB73_Zm00001d032063 [Zea mays]
MRDRRKPSWRMSCAFVGKCHNSLEFLCITISNLFFPNQGTQLLYCSSLSRRSHCRISNVWSFLHSANFIMIIWKNVMKITEQLSKTGD